jgi:4Fe-4S ferredoxin
MVNRMKPTALQRQRKTNERVVGPDRLSIVLRLYAEYVRLDLDRASCIGCQLCGLACPREAVSVRLEGESLVVDIDENACNLCEVCTAFCPTAALSMEQNGTPKDVLRAHGGMPVPRRKVVIDARACPDGCDECVVACPRGALSMTGGSLQVDEVACLRCPYCADACPQRAITVGPLFEGYVVLATDKCPVDCTDCARLCPTGALVKTSGSLRRDERYCVLCGACANACGQQAVVVGRTSSYHGRGFSAAFTRAIERLTCDRATRELFDARAFERTIEAFRKSERLPDPPARPEQMPEGDR